MAEANLLTPNDAAKFLGTGVNTLAYWRTTHSGPAFVRVGRVIRYRPEDLLAYIEANTVRPKAA